jgi:hypothetical protein
MEPKQQAIPRHVPKPGDFIAGVLVLEVTPYNTPTGKASPRLGVECKCGASFTCSYSWARAVETKANRNPGTTINCESCARKKQSKVMRSKAPETHHEQSRLRDVRLSEKEEARVQEIIRERVTAYVTQGVALGNDLGRFRIEAIEIVLIERRTQEDQFPRWTRDTIRQGLGERRFRQYDTPAVGLM